MFLYTSYLGAFSFNLSKFNENGAVSKIFSYSSFLLNISTLRKKSDFKTDFDLKKER